MYGCSLKIFLYPSNIKVNDNLKLIFWVNMEFIPDLRKQYRKNALLLEPDVEVDLMGQKIKINKYILMCKSEYFSRLFSNSFKDSDAENVSMHIANDDCQANIIKYLQDEKVNVSVNSDNFMK